MNITATSAVCSRHNSRIVLKARKPSLPSGWLTSAVGLRAHTKSEERAPTVRRAWRGVEVRAPVRRHGGYASLSVCLKAAREGGEEPVSLQDGGHSPAAACPPPARDQRRFSVRAPCAPRAGPSCVTNGKSLAVRQHKQTPRAVWQRRSSYYALRDYRWPQVAGKQAQKHGRGRRD